MRFIWEQTASRNQTLRPTGPPRNQREFTFQLNLILFFVWYEGDVRERERETVDYGN